MGNRYPNSATGSGGRPDVVPWESLERRTAPAFTVGGGLLVASVVVPVGLGAVTEWSWASGLVLVGLAVGAIAVGLLGLYPSVSDQPRWLTRAGVLSATVAGVAGLCLLGLVATAVVAAVASGTTPPAPMGVFRAIALSIALGVGLGFTLFGVARVRTDSLSGAPGGLLAAGGAVLLALAAGELLRMGFGVGAPPWVVFPALGVVAVDALAVGHSLRGESSSA